MTVRYRTTEANDDVVRRIPTETGGAGPLGPTDHPLEHACPPRGTLPTTEPTMESMDSMESTSHRGASRGV
ncbi:hypothetical protein [Natrinema caseinilyticum]|uniref:hypothetical protein n=1 Tax=Natrinema caseinilyticum TaxID=2961570 RepID=UPI0020C4F07C|nr:hypothetical protein [Natrinema caseinilyticum]